MRIELWFMEYFRIFSKLFLISVTIFTRTECGRSIEFKQFEHAIFDLNPTQARSLLSQIPADYTVYDEDRMKSLLHYVIDAAFWYEKKFNDQEQFRDFLNKYGITQRTAITSLMISFGFLIMTITNQDRSPHMIISDLLLSLAAFVCSIAALDAQASYFTNRGGMDEMIAMINDIAERIPIIDAITQEYIRESCLNSPETRVVQRALQRIGFNQ
jgi:hypothetical protein